MLALHLHIYEGCWKMLNSELRAFELLWHEVIDPRLHW